MPMSKQRRLKRQAKKEAMEDRRYAAIMAQAEADSVDEDDAEDDSDAAQVDEWVRADPCDPFIQALAEDVHAGTLEMCWCCVGQALHHEAHRQMQMRRRYGPAWHGRLNFRILQKLRYDGRRADPDGRESTWQLIFWMERKGIVRKEKGQMTWVHFYQPKKG